MNNISEQEFLATVLKLLARYNNLTLGDIRHKTRSFRRKRHISNEAVFNELEFFVEKEYIRRTPFQGRIVYASNIGAVLAEQVEKRPSFLEEHNLTKHPVYAELIKHAEARRIEMRGEKKYQEIMALNYVPDKPDASSKDERKANEKLQRVKHAEEMEKAEIDPLAGLDDEIITMSDVVEDIKESCKNYEPTAPPPNDVKGFK